MLVYELDKETCYETLVSLIVTYGGAFVTVEKMLNGKMCLVVQLGK